MLLFIKDISKFSSTKDFAKFIGSARGRVGKLFPFINSYSFEKCEILRIEDKLKGTMEYHGVLTVEPDKTCQTLINRLNGAVFLGKRVEVRPFIKRATYKDRRRLYADLELLPEERRRQDRRRRFLVSRWLNCRSG